MSKFVMNHRTGMWEPERKRPEDDIHLMSQIPNRSGWITLLQNRVNMYSVGNIRYSQTLWFDYPSKILVKELDQQPVNILFYDYVLPNAGKPAGWIFYKQ